MTRNGDPMAILEIEDSDSRLESLCFPKVWEPLRGRINQGDVCIVSGFPEDREGSKVIAKQVFLQEEEGMRGLSPFVRISISAEHLDNVSFKDFVRSLKSCPGRSPVLLEFHNDTASTILSLQSIKVDPLADITAILSEVLPRELFKVV